MKGFWKYFWLLYTLFFVTPFPMIIYYNTRSGLEGDGTSPWLGLLSLLLSVLAWALVLVNFFKALIWAPVRSKRDVQYLLQHGFRKDATVVESSRQGPLANGYYAQSITLAFRNFSGTEIRESLSLIDTRPEERRFEQGKKLGLLIDERLKTRPVMVLEDARAELRTGMLLIPVLIGLAIAAAIVWYYGYAYRHESDGNGWRFLVFYHPLLLCPVLLLASRVGIGKLLRILINAPAGGLRLKFYGLRTDARVVSASETGMYFNEQPQVRFELRYTDALGRQHEASIKKILPLTQMGLARAQTLPVFYLNDQPGVVAFASDLG